MKRKHIVITEQTAQKLREISREMGISESRVVELALREFFRRLEEGDGGVGFGGSGGVSRSHGGGVGELFLRRVLFDVEDSLGLWSEV